MCDALRAIRSAQMKRYREAATPSFLRGSLFSFCVLFQYDFFDEGSWILSRLRVR